MSMVLLLSSDDDDDGRKEYLKLAKIFGKLEDMSNSAIWHSQATFLDC